MIHLEKFSFFGKRKKKEEEAKFLSDLSIYKKEIEDSGIIVLKEVYDLFWEHFKVEKIFAIRNFVGPLIVNHYIEVLHLNRPYQDRDFKNVKFTVRSWLASEEGYDIALYDDNGTFQTTIDRYSVIKIEPDIPEGLNKTDIKKYNL